MIIVRVGVLVFIRVPVGVTLIKVLPILSVIILAVLTILLVVPLLVIRLSGVTLLVPIHFSPVILPLIIIFLLRVVLLLLLLLLVILLHLRAISCLVASIALVRFWFRRLSTLESFVQLFAEVRCSPSYRHLPT